MDWQHYFAKARTLPLRVLLRKAPTVLMRELRLIVEEVWVRVRSGQISDSDLQRTLASGISIEQLPALLRSGAGVTFFVSPAEKDARIALLYQIAPEVPDLIVAEADRICEHVFDLLGSGPTPLGRKIDWHVDFKTGHRWNPKTYFRRIRPAPYPGGYDIKVPWELSRCQHFVRLGQAYWITGNEKYAREFVAQVEDWIESNPWPFGVNWACTMDVAIRAVNWPWSLAFFLNSPSLTDEFLLSFTKSLLTHGRHIMNNLEWSETLTSNHYLSDIVGLVYLGILLPEFKEARQWREFGLQELEKEMLKQVYPDGVDFEASVSYHRLVAELFLSATLLARLNGHIFSDAYMERLEKMLEFTMYVIKPDGTVPLIGDNDNGRVHRLKVWGEPEREWVDHRYLLAIGAVLFERDDFAQAAGDQWEEASWLLGERAAEFKQRFEKRGLSPLALTSKAFPDAGVYIMRHHDCWMSVVARPLDPSRPAAHVHNDHLSFELCVDTQPVFVDPGCSSYTGDYSARNAFRSTAYHNTVQVDGHEIAPFDRRNIFAMSNSTSVRVLKWQCGEHEDLFEAEHDGYTRLNSPVIHRRRILFDKTECRWHLRDTLIGTGHHQLDFRLHLFPGLRVEKARDTGIMRIQAASGKPILALECSNQDARFVTINGMASSTYGREVSTTVLTCSVSTTLPYSLELVFSPCLR